MHLAPPIFFVPLSVILCIPLYSLPLPVSRRLFILKDPTKTKQNKSDTDKDVCMHKGCYNLSLVKIPASVSNITNLFGNSDSPQRRLSNRLEPSSHVFRLAVKRGVGSGYVFDSKQFTRNICVLSIIISTNIPMMNVRYI